MSSTFFTRFFARSRAATFSGLSSTGDSSCNSFAIWCASGERRHQRHRLVAPDAPDLLQIRADAFASDWSEPNLFSPIAARPARRFAPFNPVRSRIAINSAWLKASAPSAASRSRGRWLTGWSLSAGSRTCLDSMRGQS